MTEDQEFKLRKSSPNEKRELKVKIEEAYKWLIWSVEHNQWWRPYRCGYTDVVDEAGRYGFFEALGICEQGNINLFSLGELHEVMLPDSMHIKANLISNGEPLLGKLIKE